MSAGWATKPRRRETYGQGNTDRAAVVRWNAHEAERKRHRERQKKTKINQDYEKEYEYEQ